tara:strand:- start:995 stop:3319 length:2325 start_codon:yes stop_codon:yes gene_type:complete
MFDFLFGRTKPTPTTTTTVQTSKLPEEIAPYVTQVLEEAQKQYEIARDKGYEPYPGETIAPRTQEEIDAIAGLRGLVGGQEKYLTEAEEALRSIPTEFTAEAAQKFMSPYQQAVTDIEKRKAQEDFQRRIMPQFEKQAVDAGGMSGLGSRAGVQAAQLGSAFSQQLGDIQARGQQKAYEDAYRQFTEQGARERARAADLQNLGVTRFKTGLAEQGLAQQLAQTDRAEAQAELDKAFKEYTEQEQYPESELAQFSSFVYGNPYLRQPDVTRSTTGMLQPTSSVGQGLLGLGLTGLNIYGRAGGFSPEGPSFNRFFNPYGRKYGGRVVQRQEGGRLPVVKRSRPGRIGYGLFGRQGLFGTRFGLGGGLAGALNNAYSQGMQVGTSGQGNLVENIQSAGRDLAGLRGSTDRHVQAITAAANAIGNTLSSTLGGGLSQEAITDITTPTTPVDQSITDVATPKEVAMKAGGGLRSLPVVKRQVGGDLDFEYDLEDAAYRARTAAPLPSRNILPTFGQSSFLNTLKQLEGAYPEFSKYLSGEAARRDAEERKTLRESQMKRLKAAMPQQDRFVGLAEAARRVMGADPSKGFINALVEGMSGLDEGQREAYLKQKEQELKLLELELEGEESDLKAKQEARKEGATLPLKLAKMAKDLKPDLAELSSSALKYLENQANKKFGISVTVDEAGNFRMRKGEKFVDPKQSEEVFEYLQDGMRRYAALRRGGVDELTALGMAFPESSKPKDSGGKKGSSSSGTSNPPSLNPQVNPTNVTGMFTRSS